MSFFHSLLSNQGGGEPEQAAAPASLTAISKVATTADISWEDAAADNYVLERSTASDFSSSTEVYSGSNLSFNDTGLTNGTTYYYRVKSQITDQTDSDWVGGSVEVTALTFWAAFEDDDATPIANPYTTYSGHLMDVTQTAGELSISNGSLVKTGSGSVSANTLKTQPGTSRSRGLCVAVRFRYSSGGTFKIGLDQPGASGFAHGFQVTANAINGIDRFSSAENGIALSPDTWYHAFIVLRDNGAYFIINIDTGYYLFYVSSRWNFATVHQYIGLGGSSQIDWFKQKQLASAFTSSEWGLATSSITSASGGSTFTHGGSGWIVFFLQTKTTSGSIELRFRIEDTSNYLKLTIDSANKGQLWAVVAGVATQLGSDATMGGTAEYRILINGSNIRVFGDSTTALLINGTSSNFVNKTDGKLESEGTGGNVTYIHCLPFGLTDINVLAELEGITAVSEPP